MISSVLVLGQTQLFAGDASSPFTLARQGRIMISVSVRTWRDARQSLHAGAAGAYRGAGCVEAGRQRPARHYQAIRR